MILLSHWMGPINVILFLILVPGHIWSANILWILDLPSKSHVLFQKPLMLELIKNGHQITAMSYNGKELQNPNIKNIDLGAMSLSNLSKSDQGNIYDSGHLSKYSVVIKVMNGWPIMSQVAIKSEGVQAFLNSDEKFDLVIMQPFLSDSFLGFVYKYNAPLVYLSPNTLSAMYGEIVGNPITCSYIPDMYADYDDKMTFLERLDNTLFFIFAKLARTFIFEPKANTLMKTYIKQSDLLPSVSDIRENASLLFLNTHPSLDYATPLTPNTIEIGGLHLKVAKELPLELKKYLDEAKDGAIFFSLGTNLASALMPEDKRLAFISAFSKLKQRILWKWDQDTMPGLPSNVHLSKWLPQSDILAHKNIKMFLSHGGKLSLQESVYHGVPVVGIPVFGDQHLNSARAQRQGYAIKLNFDNVTEESVLWAVNEILQNPKYSNKAQHLSELFRDQKETPLKRAVYWIEYVLRHKGAKHLHSAALSLSWPQYLLLDILSVVGILLSFILLMLYFVIKSCISRLHHKDKQKKMKKQ